MKQGGPLVLVGGGLANSLIAFTLMTRRPDVDFLILEQGDHLGGQHVWSFFAADIAPSLQDLLGPLIVHRWQSYEVRFPRRQRRLSEAYASLTSERLDAVLRPMLGARLITGADVSVLEPHQVATADGRRFMAGAVIDGRGPTIFPALDLGYQKFIGQRVRLDRPHRLDHPIIMDATVPQIDGYRFVYTLPFGPTELLIEDTRYADGAALEVASFRSGIADYARSQDWDIAEILGEEQGVLPVALGGKIEEFWTEEREIGRSGLRAALFHPTTGYSLLDAVRLADRLADLAHFTAENVAGEIRAHSIETWRRRGFFRLLNRMLFRAAAPADRYKILQRFYGLSENLIRRFYAGEPSVLDQLRILSGKPPVPIGAALRCLRDPQS